MLTLVIGNKNYSSWSMRPWVLMRQSGIAFTERMLRFDSFEQDSQFRLALRELNPAGKVPVLLDDGGGNSAGNNRGGSGAALAVWDTLAIAETLAERFPELHLWPEEFAARARARSVVAEMHSGFGSLRSHCGMNIEAHLPQVGALLWRDQPGVRADVARLVRMWTDLLQAHGGPMLFGDRFTIADAFFAPVCMRLNTFCLPVPPHIQAYVDRVTALPAVQEWIAGALQEQDFRPFEEPYRLARD